jgi:hypothetical protein
VKPFELFVGVDWSGERGPGTRRLQVAICGPGDDAPALVANPAGGSWTRPDLAAWLAGQAENARVACGLDFSFCFPWEDRQAYFPGFADDPEDHCGFWNLVEAMSIDEESLFGGGIAHVAPFDSHFRRGIVTGAAYSRRLRVTEARTRALGLGTAESVFNLVGARQVGKSSLSGMRTLRLLKQGGGAAVWPFDDTESARLVMLETFPTAFVRMAGGGAGKVRDPERLNRILGYFGSAPISGNHDDRFSLTDDMTDALIISAALRCLTPDDAMWRPEGLSDRVRHFEGWTFGIT